MGHARHAVHLTLLMAVGLVVSAGGQEYSGVFGMTIRPHPDGALVVKVDESDSLHSAYAAGVRDDDVIVRADGEPVASAWAFLAGLDGAGRRVTVRVRRGMEMHTAHLRRSARPGRILFVSDRSGPSELFRMNADGSDLRQLTHGGLGPRAATWSPDGKRIAFQQQSPYWDIWVMNADGSDQKRVTDWPDAETFPRWSPDGASIYFVTYEWGGTSIGCVDLGTLERRSVAPISGTAGRAAWRHPMYDISPDGETLAFPQEAPDGWRLHLVTTDGHDLRPGPGEGSQITIDFAPSGERLLWRTGDEYSLYDGGLMSITALPFVEGVSELVFGATRETLIYSRPPDAGPNKDIYTVTLDGDDERRLTFHPGNDEQPEWWAPKR